MAPVDVCIFKNSSKLPWSGNWSFTVSERKDGRWWVFARFEGH